MQQNGFCNVFKITTLATESVLLSLKWNGICDGQENFRTRTGRISA